MDTPESDRMRRLIGMAAANLRAVTEASRVRTANLAATFADRTAGYQKQQLSRVVHEAIGIDPTKLRDADISHRTADFVRDNVALISRIPVELHYDVEALVKDAVERGRRNEALAKDIRARFGISDRHARLIARDQVGKYYADVNHARQRALGVRRFVWRTVGDERVRDSHDALDGEVFSYDDPPEVDGEVALPGEPVQCRCWADPVLDDLV
jgi:SPP1 gp7 family putative phage head morphogenesis protein